MPPASGGGNNAAGYIPGMPMRGAVPQRMAPAPESAPSFYSPVPQLEALQGGASMPGYLPPSGGQTAGSSGQSSGTMPTTFSPITDTTQPQPETTESLQYLNGFLRSQVGRRVRVEFLLGTNTMTDKTGTLLGVGANYILLREANSDDLLVCDFYNIKFVTVFY